MGVMLESRLGLERALGETPSLFPKAICVHYIHELPVLQHPVRSSHLEILQKTG